MKTSTLLLLVSILGLVLVAPPAYPQKTQDQLNSLMTDSINLKATVKQDAGQLRIRRTRKSYKLLQEVSDALHSHRFQHSEDLNDSLTASIKASDDKSARDLAGNPRALDALKKNLDEGMLGIAGTRCGA